MESLVLGCRARRAVVVMRTAAAAAVLATALVGAPAGAEAQVAVESFDRLNTRVSVGDTVWVTDTQGRVVTGQIFTLKDASVTIVGVGTTTLPADRVRLVERHSKSVGKAAKRGAVVGALVGAVLGLAVTLEECVSDCVGSGVLFITIPIGAGAGTLAGAIVRGVLPAKRQVVYRASVTAEHPRSEDGGKARLWLTPVFGPKVKGLSFVYSF